MHPEERSITYDTTLYPLENDLFTPQCQPDQNNGQMEDPRYFETGGVVNEFEVQQDSGVLDELTSLPLYTQYVGDYV